MNILILGTSKIERNLINLCLKSKYLERIYTASSNPLSGLDNVVYNDYTDLIKKAKKLHIDLILFANKKYIQDGFVELCKKNRLNTVSVNKKWFNLEDSRLVAKKLIHHYSINYPKNIKAPTTFPIVIKSTNSKIEKIAYSMSELVEVKHELSGKSVFLEDYLDCKICHILFLWDGKTILLFDKFLNLTEVQKDRLELYKIKLNFMLSDEKADFIGFFVTKLIWAKNDWYVSDFIMHLDENVDLSIIQGDFLYILNTALYQNLNEISY